MKKYQVELNINAIVHGYPVRHKASYTIEADIRQGWEDCAAPMALIENWQDIVGQFDFIDLASHESSRKAIVEDYAARVCFAEASKIKVTEIN